MKIYRQRIFPTILLSIALLTICVVMLVDKQMWLSGISGGAVLFSSIAIVKGYLAQKKLSRDSEQKTANCKFHYQVYENYLMLKISCNEEDTATQKMLYSEITKIRQYDEIIIFQSRNALCLIHTTDLNDNSIFYRSLRARFLEENTEKKPKRSPKILMVADLLNDTVKPVARAEKISRENIESRTPFVGDPFIECKENYVVFGSPKLGGFFRCDLAEPSKAVKLCGLPKGLDDGEYKADRYYTHLTLTKDRKRAFLDTSLVNAAGKRRWVQGMLDLATGDFDKWGETPFCCNHGQVNPADDTLAMCAWEACWEKDGQEYRKKTGWYPRMWLMKKGWREMIPAKDRNFASHEIWDDDGKGFSWCGRPGDYVYHHDLATGKQERWCGISGARHNNVSPDKKYVVCDDAPERWWRGCKWRVGFWNRETGKHVWLYSTRPPLMPRDNQSKMHPDPHPHFVMHGKYVVCTANNADGHMDLYVTPVAQMIEMTK